MKRNNSHIGWPEGTIVVLRPPGNSKNYPLYVVRVTETGPVSVKATLESTNVRKIPLGTVVEIGLSDDTEHYTSLGKMELLYAALPMDET